MYCTEDIVSAIHHKTRELVEWETPNPYTASLLILYDLLNQFPTNIFDISVEILAHNHGIRVTKFMLFGEIFKIISLEESCTDLVERLPAADGAYPAEPFPTANGNTAYPISGNLDIQKEIRLPHNGHNLLGYMVVDHPPNDQDHKFLSKFGRRIGPAIHKRIMLQHLRLLNASYLNLLAFVAHELRSPLVGIGVDTELLLRGTYGPMESNVEKVLHHIKKRVSMMQQRMRDYMSLATIESGRLCLHKELIDMRIDVIDQALDELKDELERSNARIDYFFRGIPDKTVLVRGDVDKLVSVYTNLFSNALKYGGEKRIAYGVKDKGEFYQFNVWNDGVGLTEEQASRVFDLFTRLEVEQDGVGVGLYLVKQIIEEHGGLIWVDSKPGSVNFIFTLPKVEKEKASEGRELEGEES